MVDRDREYSRIIFFELSGSFTWGKVQNPDATSFRARGDDEPRHKPHNCHTEPNITDHGFILLARLLIPMLAVCRPGDVIGIGSRSMAVSCSRRGSNFHLLIDVLSANSRMKLRK